MAVDQLSSATAQLSDSFALLQSTLVHSLCLLCSWANTVLALVERESELSESKRGADLYRGKSPDLVLIGLSSCK